MDITSACWMELVMLNSFAMTGSAGATKVDETGEMKVKHETMSVAAHLRERGQFNGFVGSSSPDHVIYMWISKTVRITG